MCRRAPASGCAERATSRERCRAARGQTAQARNRSLGCAPLKCARRRPRSPTLVARAARTCARPCTSQRDARVGSSSPRRTWRWSRCADRRPGVLNAALSRAIFDGAHAWLAHAASAPPRRPRLRSRRSTSSAGRFYGGALRAALPWFQAARRPRSPVGRTSRRGLQIAGGIPAEGRAHASSRARAASGSCSTAASAAWNDRELLTQTSLRAKHEAWGPRAARSRVVSRRRARERAVDRHRADRHERRARSRLPPRPPHRSAHAARPHLCERARPRRRRLRTSGRRPRRRYRPPSRAATRRRRHRRTPRRAARRVVRAASLSAADALILGVACIAAAKRERRERVRRAAASRSNARTQGA